MQPRQRPGDNHPLQACRIGRCLITLSQVTKV